MKSVCNKSMAVFWAYEFQPVYYKTWISLRLKITISYTKLIYGDKTLEPVIITSIASVRMRHAWVLLLHRHNFLSVNLQVYRATVMRALDKSYTKKACSNRLQATGGIRYTQIHLRVLHTVSYLEKVIHL